MTAYADLLVRADAERALAGHPRLESRHVLLSMLRDPDSPAARSLSEVGLIYAQVVGDVRQACESTSAHGGVGLTPRLDRAVGRAEGVAAAYDTPPRPEHLLWAILSDRDDHLLHSTLGDLGTSADAILTDLRRRGVRVPNVSDEATGPTSLGVPVYLERDVESVVHEVARLLPSTASLAVNTAGDGTLWLSASPEVDLEALVRTAYASVRSSSEN
jgi:ATP-dependent Clp protease ATP-binding subunit ClpA